jgi:hypothetical protein
MYQKNKKKKQKIQVAKGKTYSTKCYKITQQKRKEKNIK